ncbi:hypothetical protein QVD17_17103 [Tagetes erecta]|uniref:Uncharacterized protein n=1 Tax=Tagetes erecta TaxID=13708 RepID=A0AAD8KVA7_TARER|nr:hypothetical protein QVD17_17103 [Tagetes erecta]
MESIYVNVFGRDVFERHVQNLHWSLFLVYKKAGLKFKTTTLDLNNPFPTSTTIYLHLFSFTYVNSSSLTTPSTNVSSQIYGSTANLSSVLLHPQRFVLPSKVCKFHLYGLWCTLIHC